jgi:hypothetical protein
MRHEWLVAILLGGVGSACFAEKLPGMSLTVQAAVCSFQDEGGTKTIHKFGTVSESVRNLGAVEHATASASAGPVSTMSASAMGRKSSQASLCGPDVGLSTNTVAFEVVGPAGNVRVDFASTGATTHTGTGYPGFAVSHALFSIYGQYIICAGDSAFCDGAWSGGDTFDAHGTVQLQANTEYSLILEAFANAIGSDYDGTETATMTGGISVNAADAGAYHIKYGKGFIGQ